MTIPSFLSSSSPFPSEGMSALSLSPVRRTGRHKTTIPSMSGGVLPLTWYLLFYVFCCYCCCCGGGGSYFLPYGSVDALLVVPSAALRLSRRTMPMHSTVNDTSSRHGQGPITTPSTRFKSVDTGRAWTSSLALTSPINDVDGPGRRRRSRLYEAPSRRSDNVPPQPQASRPPFQESGAFATSTATTSTTTSPSLIGMTHCPARTIRIERYSRLPVWPVWTGVLLFLIGTLVGKDIASNLEHYWGGRVCPMILHNPKDDENDNDDDNNNNDDVMKTSMPTATTTSTTTSPFLLLVHHNHRFWWWDQLFRSITKQFLPEGFPAHPHRGFTTLTYFVSQQDGGGGGFIHRDSLGIKQSYGGNGNENENGGRGNPYNDDNGIMTTLRTAWSDLTNRNSNDNYDDDDTVPSNPPQAQWLFTGAGLLHEEMFDLPNHNNNNSHKKSNNRNSKHELYQLWVNVPAKNKLDPPTVDLLRPGKDMPMLTTQLYHRTGPITNNNNNNPANADDGLYVTNRGTILATTTTTSTTATVRVVVGRYQDYESGLILQATAPTMSDMNILHLTLQAKVQKTKRQLTDDDDDFDTETVLQLVKGKEETQKGIGSMPGQVPSTRSSDDIDNSGTSTVGGGTPPIPGWTYVIPPTFDTVLVYVRRGSCQLTTVATSRSVVTGGNRGSSDGRGGANAVADVTTTKTVPVHSTVFLERPLVDTSRSQLIEERIIIAPSRVGEVVDVMVLAGEPLYETYTTAGTGATTTTTTTTVASSTLEPVSMQGSMVMNYPHEIEQAYRDYQMGKMGRPWDHELSDDDWVRHVQRWPCQYRYANKKMNRGER